MFISIHALREEGDLFGIALLHSHREFLSTPSARRATFPLGRYEHRNDISIHALREEGDSGVVCSSSTLMIFLSTPSARRATAFPA